MKVAFVDFWEGFDPAADPIFGAFLRTHYGVSLSEEPDFLFFSDLGISHRDKRWQKCTKIFYTAENRGTPVRRGAIGRLVRRLRSLLENKSTRSQNRSKTIDFDYCDFAISHHYVDDGRHLRLPNYVRRYGLGGIRSLGQAKKVDEIWEKKTDFCCFVYSNTRSDLPGVALRNRFFKMLCEFKKVDSAGGALNNMDGYVVPRDLASYLQFIEKYKFMITFENQMASGYTTEKIFHAMLGNALPIYWGNPDVWKDFNEKSFINCHRYDNLDATLQKVIEVDRNDEQYLEYLAQPCLREGGYLEELCDQTLIDFFDRVFRIGK